MRTGPIVLAAASAVAVLALAGCVPGAGTPTAQPSASATPLFATDEEALAAAEKAYAAYVAVSDQILIDGGRDPERLIPLVSSALYDADLASFKLTTSKGWVSSGGTTYSNFSLQSYDPRDPESIVLAYVCSDVSKVRVVDAAGNSVVSPSRPDKTPLEVTFAARRGDLIVSAEDMWNGGGIC